MQLGNPSCRPWTGLQLLLPCSQRMQKWLQDFLIFPSGSALTITTFTFSFFLCVHSRAIRTIQLTPHFLIPLVILWLFHSPWSPMAVLLSLTPLPVTFCLWCHCMPWLTSVPLLTPSVCGQPSPQIPVWGSGHIHCMYQVVSWVETDGIHELGH